MRRKYTDRKLIDEIRKFYNENGRVPRLIDMDGKNGYPNGSTIILRFGSWNNALEISGFHVNRSKIDDNRTCIICGTTTTIHWYYDKNKNFICCNCRKHERHHVHGTSSPTSAAGIGIITEHIVYSVLGNDCIKCNVGDNFNSKCDLISEKYGIIDVKCSKLFEKHNNSLSWQFRIKNKNQFIDYYICLGFNINKTKFEHVWIIPNNSELVTNSSINIARNKLQRAEQYEVDPAPYNEVYQNLDVYTLPEFCNLNSQELTQECEIGDV